MNIAVWIVQGILAFVFFMAGFMKISQPKETLIEKGMGYAEDFSAGQLRLIGILEVSGAIGLILPALTGILPILTPIAAVGLILTMTGAAFTHARRGGEIQMLVINIVLLALAFFVAYGRFLVVPL